MGYLTKAATAEWDKPGYAVIVSDQGRELSGRMQGIFHFRTRVDTTMTFIPFGDGKFQIDVAGVACKVRYCLESGGTVEDSRLFVLQDGDEISLQAG